MLLLLLLLGFAWEGSAGDQTTQSNDAVQAMRTAKRSTAELRFVSPESANDSPALDVVAVLVVLVVLGGVGGVGVICLASSCLVVSNTVAERCAL